MKPIDQLSRKELRERLLHPSLEETQQYEKMNKEAKWLLALNLRKIKREERELKPN